MLKKAGSLATKIFSIFLFAAVAGATLFFAFGYRYDIKEQVVQKTSIVDITSRVGKADVYLDGKKVAGSLPFQIKGVLPGFHDIKIVKEGVLPWERRVFVKEDIVTIVYDALPVPALLSDYIKREKVFEEGAELFFSNDYVLSYLSGERSLNIDRLFANGNFVTEEIALFRENFVPVELFSDEKFLLRFNEPYEAKDYNLYAFVSFSDREFELFALPEQAENIRVDGNSDYVFFLYGGMLYSVPFAELSEDGYADDIKNAVADKVSRFDTDYKGNLFYIAGGDFFRMWYNGKGKTLMSECQGCYENLAVHNKNATDLLVLRGKESGRKLFIINRGALKILTAYLSGYPYVNGRNEIIYADTAGRVFVYDTVENLKFFAGRLDPGMEIKGWFGDDGHYLVYQDMELFLYDIFGVAPVKLLDVDGIEKVMSRGRTLFWVKDYILYSMYFDGVYLE